MVWALALIPLLSLLNHLGGQSTRIPDPRFICRMILMPLSVGLIASIMGISLDKCYQITVACLAGFSFWAVWKNGPEFMSMNATDYRDYTTPWYTPNKWLTKICDACMGVSQLTKLTPSQCKEWGVMYGCFLGMFLWPMFGALSVVNPFAFFIGLPTCLQGFIYRISGSIFGAGKGVLYAEYIWGGIMGTLIAAVLVLGAN